MEHVVREKHVAIVRAIVVNVLLVCIVEIIVVTTAKTVQHVRQIVVHVFLVCIVEIIFVTTAKTV